MLDDFEHLKYEKRIMYGLKGVSVQNKVCRYFSESHKQAEISVIL